MGGLKEVVGGLFPAHARSTATDVIAEMGRRVGGYLRGVVINMVVIGPLSGGGVLLLGVPYPFLLGVVGALLAVPAAAMIQVLALRMLAPAARRASARVPAPT